MYGAGFCSDGMTGRGARMGVHSAGATSPSAKVVERMKNLTSKPGKMSQHGKFSGITKQRAGGRACGMSQQQLCLAGPGWFAQRAMAHRARLGGIP